MKLWFNNRFEKLRKFFSPPDPEYYQYLYGGPNQPGFNFLLSAQIKHIIQVINEELEISRKFGLDLSAEDEELEKILILTVFNKYGQTLIREGGVYPIPQYEQALFKLSNLVLELSKERLEYYHDYFSKKEKETGEMEVKNKYTYHMRIILHSKVYGFLDVNIRP